MKLHNINDLYTYLQFDDDIQASWKIEPLRNAFSERDKWLNFDDEGGKNNHSLLLYRKGNHEAFSNLFSRYYADNSNTSFKPLGKLNWYIPYKDPVDKLLGGFLSSDNFAHKHHDKFKGYRHDFYDELEPLLLDLVWEVLRGSVVQTDMYDNHITPLSVILEKALIDKPQFIVGRLVGLNLDTKDHLYQSLYSTIIKKHGITPEILRLSMHRRSPYGGQKKHYLTMFKYNHADVIKELVHGPLYNEYKLVNFFEHHTYMKAKFYHG
jgi:hypothetical protein